MTGATAALLLRLTFATTSFAGAKPEKGADLLFFQLEAKVAAGVAKDGRSGFVTAGAEGGVELVDRGWHQLQSRHAQAAALAPRPVTYLEAKFMPKWLLLAIWAAHRGLQVRAVEFSSEIKARSARFEESGDPNSPHYFDRAQRYAQGQSKAVWFKLSEIKAHLELAYHAGER